MNGLGSAVKRAGPMREGEAREANAAGSPFSPDNVRYRPGCHGRVYELPDVAYDEQSSCD